MTTLNSYHSLSMKKRVKLEILKRSWWVYVFLAINLVGFKTAFQRANYKIQQLETTYSKLEQSKENLQKQKSRLSFQINSLEDPKTVEMILKKELGLVSEGQTKVYFSTPQ